MRVWEQELDKATSTITEQHGRDYKIELHAICSEENISLRVSYVIDVGSRSLKYPFRQINGIANIGDLDQIIVKSVGHLIVANVPISIYKEVK